jgi:ribosome-binding protein aMBF1 (putative translation factor)
MRKVSGEKIMDNRKKRRLEEHGWRVGSAAEFLEMSEEEAAYVEVKLLLAENVRQRRRERELTQAELAAMMQSSQSRVARIEAGDPTVSLDLLIRSLFSLGATKNDLAQILMHSDNLEMAV